MTLTGELEQAARAFGESLRGNPAVQIYLEAQQRLQADPAAKELDERSQAFYQDLVARQRAGEQLPSEEVDAFYALTRQARSHPLIAERDAALTSVKSYFANVGLDLSQALGMDYTALAVE